MLRQPWALLGLLALVLPVLVHLLSRAPARRRPFPSLRFIDESRLPPRRLTSVHEPWLLALRMAILALAALALAQPLFGARGVPRLARAIVVDTSASMNAPLSGRSTTAADSARRLATALADSASVSRVLLAASPAAAVAAATGWLAEQRATRELVVLSDFRGFAESDIARVPDSYGVRLVPIAGAVADTFRVPSAGPSASMLVRSLDDRTLVRPDQLAPVVAGGVRLDLSALSPAHAVNVRRALVTLRGAASAAALLDDAAAPHRVRLVTSDTSDAQAGDGAGRSGGERALPAWIAGMLVRVAADPLVRESAASSRTAPLRPGADDIPVLHDATGRPLLVARWRASDSTALDLAVAGGDDSRIETLAAAVALAMIRNPEALDEHETARIADAALQRLSRSPSDTVSAPEGVTHDVSATDGGPSDARLLWTLVIALLGAETLLRARYARRGAAL